MKRKKTLWSTALLFFSSCIFLNFSYDSSEETKINSSINKGVHFLKRIQRTDGAICDTVNPLFDVWETIAAAEAIYSVHKDTNDIVFKKAMDFLRANENEKGLICHNQKCKQTYCLETTAMYFLLLIKTGQSEKVKKRIPFILELQKSTGEWEIGNPDVREQKTFPSVTAFMLWLLNESHVKPLYEKQANEFLAKSQNNQGHFGMAWEYYDCPAYGLWPSMNIPGDARQLNLVRKKAGAYIRKSQSADGSWFYKGNVAGSSAELQTALMLSAIINYKDKENTTTILKGVDFLIKKQQQPGSWDGGNFPVNSNRYVKKEYVFATARSIVVLNQYLKTNKK